MPSMMALHIASLIGSGVSKCARNRVPFRMGSSNVVKIDLEGNVIGGDHGVNYAGFIIHAAIHAHVPDARWIMHTHTPEGIAVSCKESGLTNTNFYSAMIWDHVAYHDFEGLTHRPAEQSRLVASIGDSPVVILRSHGLLAHGRTAEEAFEEAAVALTAVITDVETVDCSESVAVISTETFLPTS